LGRRGYPLEFRRKSLDLLEEGRSVTQVAHDLDISEQPIYTWRRQDRIDKGLLPGLTRCVDSKRLMFVISHTVVQLFQISHSWSETQT
jgi:transposase-like protein